MRRCCCALGRAGRGVYDQAWSADIVQRIGVRVGWRSRSYTVGSRDGVARVQERPGVLSLAGVYGSCGGIRCRLRRRRRATAGRAETNVWGEAGAGEEGQSAQRRGTQSSSLVCFVPTWVAAGEGAGRRSLGVVGEETIGTRKLHYLSWSLARCSPSTMNGNVPISSLHQQRQFDSSGTIVVHADEQQLRDRSTCGCSAVTMATMAHTKGWRVQSRPLFAEEALHPNP